MRILPGLLGVALTFHGWSAVFGQTFTDKFSDNRQTQREDNLSSDVSNVSMTAEPEEASLFCGSAPGRSVWLRWKPSQDGLVDIQVVGTGFTPMIGLYTGKTFADLLARNKACSITNRLLANVFAADTYEIAVAGLNNSGGDFNFSLTLVTVPIIIVQPADTDVTIGEAPQFSVSVLGPDPKFPQVGGPGASQALRFQWKHAGTNLVDALGPDGTRPTGSTGATLILNNVQAGWQGPMTVEVSNGYGSALSRPAILSLGLAPKIVEQPKDQLLVRLNANASFNVRAIGKEPLSYQWQLKSSANPGSGFVDVQEGGKFSGSKTSSLAISTVANSEEGKYRVIVSNAAGTASSSEATLTVDTPGLQITPLNSLTAGVGDSATFKTTATVTSQVTPKPVPTFQWLHDGAVIAGATTATFSIPRVAAGDAGEYTVGVTIPGVTKTSSASLTVPVVPTNDHYTNAIVIPFVNVVSTNGYNFGASFEAGEPLHFGQAPTHSVWWSWAVPLNCTLTTVFLKEPTFAGRVAVYQGSNLSSLQDARFKRDAADRLTFFSTSGLPYAIAVDGINGAVGDIKLNVVNTTDVPLPSIKRDCPDGIFLACDPCKFSVDIESIAPITFKWQRVDVVGAVTNFVDLDQVTHPTTVSRISPPNSTPERLEMTIPSGKLTDEGYYRIIIANCGGVTNSRIAKLTLRRAPEIQIQPADVSNKRECLPVNFDVFAKGCPPFLYQWRMNGVDISNQTSNRLVFSSVSIDNIGDYSVVIANDMGAVTSRVARLTVDPLPHITVQPQGQDVRSCVAYTFNVTADDSCNRLLSYQWQFNGKSLTRSGTVTTDRELKLSNVQTNDTGDYRVIVSTVRGSTTSLVSRLTIHAGPWITNALAQPLDQGKIKQGDSFTLKGVAESCSPLNYQWYFSGSGSPPPLLQWYPYTNPNLSLSQKLVPASAASIQNIFIETNYVTNIFGISTGTYTLTNYLVRTNTATLTNLSLLPGEKGTGLTVNSATPANSGYYLLTMINDDRWTNSKLTRVTVYVPPPNDHYEDRILVPGTNATVTGYNIFATSQTNNDPVISGGPRYEPSVWWTWKAPPDPGFFSVDFSGSSFKTYVALSTNLLKDQFAVAGGPQASGPSRLLRMGLTDLTTVQIAVNGVNNEQGNVQFKLTYEVDRQAPVIARQPESVAVLKGANVTFSADYGNPYVGYQWWFAADRRPSTTNTVPSDVALVPIPGAAGAAYAQPNATTNKVTLSLPNVAEINEGYYVVVLTNKFGQTRSEAARLTIGGVVRGMVTDATTGVGIPFAQISGGDPSSVSTNLVYTNFISTLTDTNGNYELFGLKPGTLKADFYAEKLVVGLNTPVGFIDQSTFKEIMLTGKKNNYYDYENHQVALLEGGAIRHDFSMSPILLQGMRFVLNWGASPADMDSHLVTPFLANSKPIEVNPGAKGSRIAIPFATHDHDVRNGNGPETITIQEFTKGTYKLYVQKAFANDAGTLANSKAVVNIYTNRPSGALDQQALFTIHAPFSGDGLFWYVCDIDGATRQVTVVNKFVPVTPSFFGGGASESLESNSLAVRKNNSVQLMANVTSSIPHEWELGDGITSQLLKPTANYVTPGSKTISLKLIDSRQAPPFANQRVRTNYILVTNDPPSVLIRKPFPNQEFHIDTPITIEIVANDTDSPLDTLELFAGTESNRLSIAIKTNSPSNWEGTSPWSTTQIGTFTFFARAKDIHGEMTRSAPVSITIVNDRPSIVLTSPASDTLWALGSTTNQLIARAIDPDTPLRSIEFIESSRLLPPLYPVPTGMRQWTTNHTYPANAEGDFIFTARATDIFGEITNSPPIRVAVRDLRGDVLIVQNSRGQNNQRISELLNMEIYISEIPYEDTNGLTSSLVTRVLDQKYISDDILKRFKLVIWHDLGETGLTDTHVLMFQRAYQSGIPLYFIGEKLASVTSGLSERAAWSALTQQTLAAPGLSSAGAGDVMLLTDKPPHKIFRANWPIEANIVFPSPMETTSTIGPRSQVMAKREGSDALILYPSQYEQDFGRVRTATQNFSLPSGNNSDLVQVRLFKYIVAWLLRLPLCNSVDLALSTIALTNAAPDKLTEVSARSIQTGTNLTYSIQITRGGECGAEAVIVTNFLPANVYLLRDTIQPTNSFTIQDQDRTIVFRFGRVEGNYGSDGTQTGPEIRFTVIPLAAGILTNRVSIQMNSIEVDTENNTSVLTTVVEGPTRPAPKPTPPSDLRIGSGTNGRYQLSFTAELNQAYVVEVSTDLKDWTKFADVTASDKTAIVLDLPEPTPQRFYRVQRR